ncbi:MAG: hypothetical protein M1598_01990 [Actinobacteria bacterium]|nr:hypothetical protein [Actinomycetota bacterium]
MIPDRLMIGGHEFQVEFVEVVNKHVSRRAEIDHLAGKIRIDASMMASRQEESLLHEVLHELDQQCHVGLSEEDLWRLAEGLYAVLKVNGIQFGPKG